MSITPNVPPNVPPPRMRAIFMSRPRRRCGFPWSSSCCSWVSECWFTKAIALARSSKAPLAQSDSHADVLSKELEQTNSRVALLRAQLDVTSQKLGLTQAELARARTMAQQIQQDQQDQRRQTGGPDRPGAAGERHQDWTSLYRSNRSQDRYSRHQEGFGRHQEEPHQRGRRLE